ncbi:transmembrane amino acid transporter protein-domain-containing protein [Syncephalastrum racemosum]|uniref:Transmembrane amino acid transporter protein-domain-containing protein n=1 Tax=Syncephalastrum racemosum TaxID=13706 RepID=A0A1X2H7W0_SYNRA|nr:transmembrane amino acid transporter protein-domain-containing protein [Syncephalastrum racemosum]
MTTTLSDTSEDTAVSMREQQSPSSPIRVPNNAYPNYQYGATSATAHPTLSYAETIYYSPAEDPSLHLQHVDSQSSFRQTLGSLANSVSRTSMMYIAENLQVPSPSPLSQHGDYVTSYYHQSNGNSHYDPMNYEEQQPVEHTQSRDSDNRYLGEMLCKSMSQRTSGTEACSFLPETIAKHTTTVASIQHLTDDDHEKSTFVQSVFNAMNVLIGVGILAFPLAFRCAGWLVGTFAFVFCAIGTNYTAKLLARCMDASPSAKTYGDIGLAAFGERGRTLIGGIFVVELFTMAVAMATLLGDGLQVLWDDLEIISARLLSFVVLVPFLFLPIRHLALTSLIGIVSCASLVIIVLYDGFSKNTRPGSLWDPMTTEMWPSDPSRIPLSFGLMMAGFAGHAVFPTLYRDMNDPKRYNQMVDITYALTILVYVAMAAAGYLMFGSETLQEITQNLAITPGFCKWLNDLACWLVVITPIAKFALIMNPLNITCELWFQNLSWIEPWLKIRWVPAALTTLIRPFMCAFVLFVATIFPGFDKVMSLLGALFSFSISAIFPILCYRRLYQGSLAQGETIGSTVMLVLACTMAALGTVWSFLPLDKLH